MEKETNVETINGNSIEMTAEIINRYLTNNQSANE